MQVYPLCQWSWGEDWPQGLQVATRLHGSDGYVHMAICARTQIRTTAIFQHQLKSCFFRFFLPAYHMLKSFESPTRLFFTLEKDEPVLIRGLGKLLLWRGWASGWTVVTIVPIVAKRLDGYWLQTKPRYNWVEETSYHDIKRSGPERSITVLLLLLLYCRG